MRLTAILLLVSIAASAQKVDYNTIILPKSAKDVEFAEKLVQLAWQNNPGTEILDHQKNISNLRIQSTRWTFLDNFRVTGNLNEFNIRGRSSENPLAAFYPRYNVSAVLTIGDVFTRPLRTKVEKENLRITELQENQQKLTIRSKVLAKYQVYLSNKEIFEIRSQILEDSQAEYKRKEQSFTRGEISLADFNIVLDRYNQQKINKVQSEKEYMIARIELEELIGMKLSDVQ